MKRRLLTFALAALTVGLLGSCSKINERIDGLDNRVENIENEKIASIEQQIATINQSIADLETIRKDITDLKEEEKTLGKRIDTLKAYVGDLSRYAEKDWATALFATLDQLNATKDDLLALQKKVDGPAISGAISNLETRISTLEARVSALEEMIQSVTIVPAYADGSVESTNDGVLHLDIIVTPAEAVAAITKDCLKVMVNEAKVKTKAVDLDTVAVTKFKVDAAKGSITARADISSVLPVASGKALTIAVNVRNGISDYTTEFYPVEISTNVETKEENDTTKVTIKADEDFPGPVIGNIVVAEGFKESKPTTIDVQGIGTVTFDKTATNKIKANAEQAGATSIFFKVEDVTTTKPVENADVVLEVTMKTVDENGAEVFSEDNAGEGAEVTIEIHIPEEKDVAFVNSVTLVNDAGEPIEGGVVPGSEYVDKEKGILSFQVNHFSKYAIDYVTNDQFKAVPGEFSVGATKKVQFSKGNLYWDGDSYEFEANQYTIGTWNAENHVNYFFWSKEESVAKDASYADASAADTDVFFTNATAETAKADFTVSGVTGEFRTLSAAEWTYILSTRANAANLLVENVTVCGVEHCLVIAPDACLNGYKFDNAKKSYDAAAWATAEAAGLVCLPPAGYRDGAEVKSGEGNGFYWASSTNAADKASNLGFKKSDN